MAATQGAVGSHTVLQQCQPSLHDGLLHREERPLGVQQFKRTAHTVAESQLGQAVPRLLGVSLRLRRAQLVVQGGTARECIGHIAERGLDGALVLGNGNIALNLGHGQVGAIAAGVEDRLQQLGREAPRAVLEEV